MYFDCILWPPQTPPRFLTPTERRGRERGEREREIEREGRREGGERERGREGRREGERSPFVLASTPGHGACPGLWLAYPVTLHWGKLTFSLAAAVSNQHLPGLEQDFVPTSSSLCRSCVCCCNFFELHMCINLAVSKDTVSLESPTHTCALALTVFLPVPQRSLNLEGRNLIRTVHLGLRAPKFLTPWTLSSCSLRIIVTIRTWGSWTIQWSMGTTIFRNCFIVMLI